MNDIDRYKRYGDWFAYPEPERIEMSELKKCPFCGQETHIGEDIDFVCNTEVHRYWGQCMAVDCMSTGPVDLGKSGASEAWNTRPLEDALQAEVDRLKAKYNKLMDAVLDSPFGDALSDRGFFDGD